ncbi:MAG TPA: S9 family peptidase [Woeseiaceae bacterium]|nr:S9 family peptidase [Woeseiaceae bacterium]
MRASAAPTLISCTCIALLPAAAGADDKFGIDEYHALTLVSGIAASPDGAYVAYTASTADLEADAWFDAVWLQPAEGGEPLRMSAPASNTSAPQWSPDGRYLAVLSDRKDETAQVWLYDRRGGDAQQVTDLPQGVDQFEWAPDSSQLLLLAEDPTPDDLAEEPPKNPRPWVIDRLQFKEDYVGYLDRYRAHVHVIDLASRETRQVTFGDYEDSEPAWAPDSRRIAFVSNRTDDPDSNRNTDIWVVDTGKPDAAPTRVTSAETSEAAPSWSPDGRRIVCTSTAPGILPIYALPRLAVVDTGTGALSAVAALDEIQVFSPRFTADGTAILAITEDRGGQDLIRVDAKSGAVQSLVDGEDVVTEFTTDAEGDIFVLVSRPDLPAEIFSAGDGELRQLGHVNAALLDGLKLATVEKHAYSSADGTALETFIVTPPGARQGRRLPALLYIHGGPQAQFDYRFNSDAQLLASRGFLVVMPNPRGSFGYGQDFAAAIYRDWGGIDYQDVVAAVDFAVAEGWADPERLAVYGWSYGGMMTNHVITKTDRFDAAITGASATLYVANYGHDQYQRWWEEELGLPWLAENRGNWERISPFYSLDKVVTPTLVVGGEDDWNVPILNSEQLYIALKRRGIPTQLVVYPNEGHILSVPSYERDLYERYFDWLGTWVSAVR